MYIPRDCEHSCPLQTYFFFILKSHVLISLLIGLAPESWLGIGLGILMFNATFNNISVIS
jgi:hypothetical protein